MFGPTFSFTCFLKKKICLRNNSVISCPKVNNNISLAINENDINTICSEGEPNVSQNNVVNPPAKSKTSNPMAATLIFQNERKFF